MECKIKELRKNIHMTQEDLAKKSGVSRTTISSLENNKARFASTKTLLKIAQTLGVSINQIFL